MNMVDAPTLLTVIYVLVDDWYQQQGQRLVPTVSALPILQLAFSDSEILTLLVAMDCFPYLGEQQFLGFIRANYLSLFPKLLEQSQFNRCVRQKEFIGGDWQAEIYRTTGNRVSTPMHTNQHQQIPPAFSRLLSHFRDRIEGVFNEVQNTGRNLERLLRKKVAGLCVHVAAKMASHTLRILLRQRFGIDVLTFEQSAI